MTNLPRIFVIGDSISIQYGPYLEKALTGYFGYDRKGDDDIKAEDDLDQGLGANGGDSDRVLAYIRQRAIENPIQADVLLVNCGLHDIKRAVETGKLQVSIDRYEANLKAILEEAQKAGLALIWMQTTPVVDEIHQLHSKQFARYESDVTAYNKVARRLMEEAGRPIIDLHTFSKRFLSEGVIDHVHFSDEVRQQQGVFLAGCLHGIHSICGKRLSIKSGV